MKQHYNHLVCGGTFDHFHSGHEAFLQFALSQAEHITIGVTSDSFSHNKSATLSFETFAQRRINIEDFLQREKSEKKATIIAIDDMYGPTLSSHLAIDAIVVTKDTKKGAELINGERKKRNLAQLPILVASFVQAEDGSIIASSRIRKGEIDRNGKVYLPVHWTAKDFLITPKLRTLLKKPFGELIESFNTWIIEQELDPYSIITVGDVITKTFNESGPGQKIAVVDFVVERVQTYTSMSQLGFMGDESVITIKNPAGRLSATLLGKTKEIFQTLEERNRTVFYIDGEEDLSVLAMVLGAPLGFTIFYGQPKRGVVRIIVSPEVKEKAYSIVSQCEFY